MEIETRSWSPGARVGWALICLLFMAIGYSAFIASFFAGSGDAPFKVVFGLTGAIGTVSLIVIWTHRSRISVTRERIRWRIGSALIGTSHDLALADVDQAEIRTSRSRSRNGNVRVTYRVWLRLRDGEQRKVAVFHNGDYAAAHLLSQQIEQAMGR